MYKILIVLLFIFVVPRANEADSTRVSRNYSPVPFLSIFDGIFINSGKVFIYNYGINTALMAAGTFALVKSEIDWKYMRFANDNKFAVSASMPAVLSGAIVPVIVPLSLYGIGRGKEDLKLQTAGVAVAQASIISTVLTTGIKAFTSRRPPDILDDDKKEGEKDFSTDWKFGFFKRVPFDGWPSGHTSAAWAMAATLTEFYPNNIPLAIGLYGYATYMAIGVSTSIHWLSDGFAGALFGYAVGKTVARHFTKEDSKYSVFVLPNSFMIVRKF